MCRVSVLNDALNCIMNAERGGKRQVLIRPASKVIIRFLQTMQKHGMSTSPPLPHYPPLLLIHSSLHTHPYNTFSFPHSIKGYIGEFEVVDDRRSGKIVVELNGRINKCGVISPRYDIKIEELEKWTSYLLPSRQFGFIVLTSSAGIMDHEEARKKHVGGKVLSPPPPPPPRPSPIPSLLFANLLFSLFFFYCSFRFWASSFERSYICFEGLKIKNC